MNQKQSLMNLLLLSAAATNTRKKRSIDLKNYRNASPNTYIHTYDANTYSHVPTASPYMTTPSATSSPSNKVQQGTSLSATVAAETSSTFIPALLAALYAADEAVGLNPEATGPFALSPLEYDYNALEPYISEETLRLHHDVLHQKYVDSLNNALARYPEFYNYTLSEFLLFPDRLPSDAQAQILHNAGGHYNHDLTWKLIGPANKNVPTGAFAESINRQFGSFENMTTILKEAGLSVFGTGYAWLALNPYGRLIVVTSEEQLTPIALRTVPLLPIDVWEHAYYLDTGSNRGKYIDNYLNAVNWNRVGDRYSAAMSIFDNMNALEPCLPINS